METPADPRKQRTPASLQADETADNQTAEPVDSDHTPVLSSPLQLGGTPFLASEATFPDSGEPAELSPSPMPVPPMDDNAVDDATNDRTPSVPSPIPLVRRAAAIEQPTPVSTGNRLIGVLRVLWVRNIELTRKYSVQTGHAVGQFAQSIARRAASVRIGEKSIREVMRDTGQYLRTAPGFLLVRLQRLLESSDVAVLALTLFLIAACVLLTLFAIYLVNRF